MATRDMRRMKNPWLILVLACQFLALALADDFKLLDESTIKGTPTSWDENGVIFNLDTGGFSHRVAWGKFDQDWLRTRSFGSWLIPLSKSHPSSGRSPKPSF